MDFWDLTKLLFRRWYVTTPLLLLALGASAYTWVEVEPDWKSTAYVQLIPPVFAPDTKPDKGPVNPWLDLGLESLNTAAGYATQDQKFLTDLGSKGYSPNVVITAGYPAPIVTIEVVGSTREQATKTTDQVVKRFTETVTALQVDHGAAANSMIVTRRLDLGDNLAQTGGKVKRAFIAVTGAGLLMSVALTIVIDAILRRIHRRGTRTEPDEARSGRSPPGPSPHRLSVPRLSVPRPSPAGPPGSQSLRRLAVEPGQPPVAIGAAGVDHRPVPDGFLPVPVPPDMTHDLASPHTGSVERAEEARRPERGNGTDQTPVAAAEATLVVPLSVRPIGSGGGRGTRR